MTGSAIVVRDVSKSFGDVQALNDLELDVPDGAFFVLLGPSGAGKTTTLRVIAGLEKPDTGLDPPHGDRRHEGDAGRTRSGDGVPELRAVPEADRGAEHRVAAAGAQAVQGRHRRVGQARRGAAAHRAAARAQAGADVRRRDAARRARARARARPARVPDGRAADEPRPQAARRDAHGADAHPPLAGPDVPVRHQRPGRGHVDGRPGRGAARGHGPAGRHADGDLRPSGQPLGGVVRRQPAHEPARVHGQRPPRGRRLVAARTRASVSRAIARRCSACAARTSRSTSARSRRRSRARSTRSSRSAIARSSTSRSASTGS